MKPFESINIRNGNTFTESDDKEREIAGEVIEKSKNIISRTVTKHEWNEKWYLK